MHISKVSGACERTPKAKAVTAADTQSQIEEPVVKILRDLRTVSVQRDNVGLPDDLDDVLFAKQKHLESLLTHTRAESLHGAAIHIADTLKYLDYLDTDLVCTLEELARGNDAEPVQDVVDTALRKLLEPTYRLLWSALNAVIAAQGGNCADLMLDELVNPRRDPWHKIDNAEALIAAAKEEAAARRSVSTDQAA